MPRKAELVEAMSALGETPPKAWTVAEIETRLTELRLEQGIAPPRTGKVRTPLRQMMVELNQANRKKQILIEHVKTLGVPISGHETMKVLMHKGIQAIYDLAEPSGQDPVGFGTHAYPVVATSEPPTTTKKTFPPAKIEASKTSSTKADEDQELKAMIGMLTTSMMEMKEEIAALKEEPPRKQRSAVSESVASFEMLEEPQGN